MGVVQGLGVGLVGQAVGWAGWAGWVVGLGAWGRVGVGWGVGGGVAGVAGSWRR